MARKGSMPKEDLRTLQEINKVTEARRKLDVEHMGILSKIGRMYGKQADNTEEQMKHIKASNKIQTDIYKTMTGISDEVADILKTEGMSLNIRRKIAQSAQEARVGTKNQLKGMTKVLEVQQDVHKAVLEEAQNRVKVGQEDWKAVDTAAMKAKIEKKIAEVKETYGTRDIERVKVLNDEFKTQLDVVNALDAKIQAQKKLNAQINAGVNSFKSMLENITSTLDSYPGGEWFREFIGLGGDAQDKIMAAVRENMTGMVTGTMTTKEGVMGIGKAFSGVNLKMLAVVGVFVLLGKLLTDFSKNLDKVGEQFGTVGVKEFSTDLIKADAAMAQLGYEAGAAGEAAAELSSNFGVTFDKAVDLAPKVADMSKALGMGVKEGAALLGQLTEIAGLSEEAAIQLASATDQLAVAEGVAPAAVMKDIQKDTKNFARFMKDGGENVMRAAIQAKKLGVEFSTIAGIADSLLDFQNSLNAEYEASAIIGKRLNYQKARELALNNDIEGAMGEVLNQLGGEEEFNKMNAIQRDALAKSIGVSVDQLGKFVSKEKEAQTLSGQLASQKPFEEMAGKDAISSLTQVINSFKSMAASLTAALGPALNAILKPLTMVFGFIARFGPLIGKLVKWFMILKGVSLALTAATWLFNTALLANPIALIAVAVVGLIAGLAFLIKKIGGVQKVFEIFGKVVKFALTIAFAPLIMAWKALKAVGSFVGKLFGGGSSKGASSGRRGGSRNEARQRQLDEQKSRHKAKFDDFISRPGQPVAQFSSDDTVIGAKGKLVDMGPVVGAINTLKTEMSALREDMENYLGTGGTAVRGMAKGTVAAIDDASA